MKPRLACILPAAALIFSGCGKSDSNSSAPGQNPLHAPSDYVGTVVKGQQRATQTVDVASLTQAIQHFTVTEGRAPNDLNELVSKEYLPRLPAPPRGMRFDYDSASGRVRVVPVQ